MVRINAKWGVERVATGAQGLSVAPAATEHRGGQTLGVTEARPLALQGAHADAVASAQAGHLLAGSREH